MTSAFSVHEVQRAARTIDRLIRPTSVEQALNLLASNEGARPVAGGTDLLLDLERGGPGESVTLVDMTTIEGFRTISDATSHWVLAGGVTHNQVVRHRGVRATALPLAQACLEVGSPQLRNRATISGNLATASPANDTISALMALGASVELKRLLDGVIETRIVGLVDFFTGFRETVLDPGELITAIHVPKLTPTQRGMWVKLGLRRAQAISVVHAGIVIDLTDEGVVSAARVAMGSVAATVVLVDEFADVLVGRTLDGEAISEAAVAVAGALSPITDGRATAQYRSDGVDVLLRRALGALASETQGSTWPSNPPTLSDDAQLERTAPAAGDVDDMSEISVVVNGTRISGTGAMRSLLDWVRDEAGATGMKEGCAEGECGACSMQLDGAAVMSCLVTAAQADRRSVTTVEGLDHPIQQAFIDDFAVQCGFCIPGFLVSGARLLDEFDDPDDDQIRLALSGNLCRCTGYYPIIDAVRDAAVVVRGNQP